MTVMKLDVQGQNMYLDLVVFLPCCLVVLLRRKMVTENGRETLPGLKMENEPGATRWQVLRRLHL